MIHGAKKTFRGGRSDAERAIIVLDEFIESAPGNTAEFIVDSESSVVRVVTFQTARQKCLFAAFLELVLVDSTHDTNVNRYKLFTFAVHDVFGRGQYVQHALVQTEEKPNLALAIAVFKKINPEWANIRVVMTDKALHEKEVLHEAWPYSRRTAMPLVERLDLPPFEITGVLAVVRFNVGQAVPVIKAIPQAERIRHAMQTIDEANNHDLLARWDDYGYATYEQWKLMEKVATARNSFNLVQATVDWIDKVEVQVEDVVKPFKDTLDAPKVDYKTAVENLNLVEWFFGRHPQYGSDLLDFRENLWLHTGSIIGALFVLRETYHDVGIINPRFLDFDTMEQRAGIARPYGAADPGLTCAVSVVNLKHHWGAFFVDQRRKRCYLFDPMQLKSNITTLKDAVRTVVEPMLDMMDQLQIEMITGFEQKDSTSSGLWCLVVIELLLSGATPEHWRNYWNDTLYNSVGYLRMRYLHKILKLQNYFSVGETEGNKDK
ncbi:uncharacterized protein IUM83_19342 [Phytophthora cinnamomi]|uniref:uncharacterized protein n=1 Tax=Phytophthora cinnamomi TaxID=4785 RepID=UPI003559BC48|nr:hypothetical protein IUM83_19342 [Phytophthora cinnamomi]